MRAVGPVLAGLSAAAAFAAAVSCAPGPPAFARARGPLRHEAFVWQRAWTEDVSGAVARRDPRLAGLVVLAGEVSWPAERNADDPATTAARRTVNATGDPAGGPRPQLARVRYDAAVLAGGAGLALRLETPPAWPGDPRIARALAGMAAGLLAEARARGLAVSELQVDCDAPEARLDAYRAWVRALRDAVRPTPLTITALPAWLDHPAAFAALAHQTDGFVLQVHSLERPTRPGAPRPLCDPARARAAVERAARAGVPFRVALPTYGYRALFDRAGKLIGGVADGSPVPLAAAYAADEVRADPAAMAALVRAWTGDRPALLQGVIWYRLPVPGDRLNWRPETLAAVLGGRAPQPRLALRVRRAPDSVPEAASSTPGRPSTMLFDVAVVNEGEGEGSVGEVRLAIAPRRVAAADGLQGFAPRPSGDDALVFDGARRTLRPGEELPIGWLRLGREIRAAGLAGVPGEEITGHVR